MDHYGATIWNDEAKHLMKQWAIKAGLVDPNIKDQCKIVYDLDCALIAIQQLIHESNHEVHNENGQKFILVVAAGGAADIACYEIFGKFDVQEIYRPSGGPWGGCYIDDQYIELLYEIFGNEWMKEFEEEAPDVMMDVIDKFQSAKESFFENSNARKHNVAVHVEFIWFCKRN